MKSILLTGATGFLGSNLLKSFLSKGYKVVILKRSFSSVSRINEYLSSVSCFDVDQVSVSDVFDHCDIDVIVHTACSYGRRGEDVSELVKANVQFGLELIEGAIRKGVKTFVNTDSLLAKNVSPYSLSKSHFKEWLIQFTDKIQVINFRIEHMYGPGDDTRKFVPWLIDQMLSEDQSIGLTSGLQKRDFIHIDDIVSAYNLVISKSERMRYWSEYDLGSGTLTTVKDFVIMLAKALEVYKSFSVVPRLVFGQVPCRENEIMEPIVDNRALLQLGWKPEVSVSQGIKGVIEQY